MNIEYFIRFDENINEVPDEYFFERIRLWRNVELSSCDWTQIADSTADKTAWAIYRQALRDLPSQNKDPKKIKFPTKPE